jgi:hypothetical protein
VAAVLLERRQRRLEDDAELARGAGVREHHLLHARHGLLRRRAALLVRNRAGGGRPPRAAAGRVHRRWGVGGWVAEQPPPR